MAIDLHTESEGRTLVVHLTGKLHADDYAHFAPAVDEAVQHGKVRMLVEMHDFHGWSAGALWEDTKFAVRHFGDIERLAMVGEKRWQKGMATFCRPFTKAEIRYFDHAHEADARTWLQAAAARQ